MSEREVIRCWSCDLNQFVLASRMCRKCHQSIDGPTEPVEVAVEAPLKPEPIVNDLAKNRDFPFWFSFSVWEIRRTQGMSQRDVAKRLNVTRTYISKIENGECLPSIRSVARLAGALSVSPTHLVRMTEFLVMGS